MQALLCIPFGIYVWAILQGLKTGEVIARSDIDGLSLHDEARFWRDGLPTARGLASKHHGSGNVQWLA
jgi:hypothetical protein